MRPLMKWAGVGPLFLITGLQACTSVSPPVSNQTSPFFFLDSTDRQRYQELARGQEAQLSTCAERHDCDRVHFTRALVALYENQTVAVQHFQDVVAVAPGSRLASSSRLWLKLLQDASPDVGRTNPFARATAHLVRDFLDRELTIQQLTKELDGSAVQALQRGLKARDKQVEELTKQLDALKRIDQEMKEKEKTRQKKPAAKLRPLPGNNPQP